MTIIADPSYVLHTIDLALPGEITRPEGDVVAEIEGTEWEGDTLMLTLSTGETARITVTVE